jgi:RNA polymerase sigma-70 factor (ECF subfamily)
MTAPKRANNKKIKDKDFELIRAINSGQYDRFPDLVKRYEQKLYNFGLRMCRDPADAEDTVQETFLNVFRYLKNFRYETKFKNWLYRAAVSTCIKRRRKSKFAPERELSLDEFHHQEESESPNQVPNWALMPLDKLLNNELLDQINQAVFLLPEKYRSIVWNCLKNCPNIWIMSWMKQPVKTSKNMLKSVSPVLYAFKRLNGPSICANRRVTSRSPKPFQGN